ncbi:MAG: hypothetical protein KF860_13795 [Cyclobacteriaceae bacterium]|nr:hypothetical protein [Cyclobacteriaceae bacterium]
MRREVMGRIVAGLDKKELVLLKFTEKEKQEHLDWEHDLEFEFKGVMYDVVDTKVKGDTTYYWCWEDEAETIINNQLDDLVAMALGDDPQHKKNINKLHSFFQSLYFSPIPKNEYSPWREMISTNLFIGVGYQSLASSPSVPPPENIV